MPLITHLQCNQEMLTIGHSFSCVCDALRMQPQRQRLALLWIFIHENDPRHYFILGWHADLARPRRDGLGQARAQ